MEMQTNREIEKTLDSLDGISRAEGNPFFYDRVMNRINGKEAKVISLTPAILWQAAACFAVLIALNVLVLSRSGNSQNLSAQETSNPVAKEYFSYFSNDQF